MSLGLSNCLKTVKSTKPTMSHTPIFWNILLFKMKSFSGLTQELKQIAISVFDSTTSPFQELMAYLFDKPMYFRGLLAPFFTL
jgi:hypothetical protein